MIDLSGTSIDAKYDLLRMIGHGGMGAVYEARCRSTNKRCAVKLLQLAERAGDADSLRRFVREARAGGLIESEHVLAAFDSGIDEAGHPYYAMDFLEGEDLEKTLRRLGSLTPEAASKIVLQASLGLIKAHAVGIVHRDVKPANLFLVPGEDDQITVKVLDFGIAKVRHEDFDESSAAVTRTGSMLGTPRYMSPEQIRRASKIDASADVWSLGVVLFECLCGRHPWDDTESLGTLMAAILTGDVPLIQDRAPWVNAELAEILERAVSRDSARRFRSAKELGDALRAVLPDGSRLMGSDLRAPTEAERTTEAKRKPQVVSAAFESTLRQESLPGSYHSVPPPRRASRAISWGVALTLAVAGLGAWIFERDNAQQASAGSTSSATSEPVRQRYLLQVSPAGVAVSVNGIPRTASDGKIAIEGPLGSAHTVRLTSGGRAVESRVALTAEGLIPAELRLDAPTAPPLDLPVPIERTAATRLGRATDERFGSPAKRVSPATSSRPRVDSRPAAREDTIPATTRLDDKFD